MTAFTPLEDPARAGAAAVALELVQPGMRLGLGSGRAVFALVELLDRRFGPEPPVRVVAASEATATLARGAGIELLELDGTPLDLAIDGADEVERDGLGLLKGGGGALLREKLVIGAAERLVIVAEIPKLVERLGTANPLPVEVVRFGWPDTRRRLLGLVGSAALRVGPLGAPVVTDEGHYLLDCSVPPGDLRELAQALKATVGVVEHGLFLDMADQVLLGQPDGMVTALRREGG